MKHFLISILGFGALICASGFVSAKLPALSDDAKAKAAEAAAKAAWNSKVDGYQLCRAQEKIAVSYLQKVKATGGPMGVPTATPPCTDPGVFSYAAVEEVKPAEATKPIEAAGAHSPATTAASPPNGKQSDAVVNPAKKP